MTIKVNGNDARCADCLFSFATAPAPGEIERRFECRRFPPTNTSIATSAGLANVAAFPQVHPDAYCGEFAPRASYHGAGDA